MTIEEIVIKSIINGESVPDSTLADIILNSYNGDTYCDVLNSLSESDFLKYLKYLSEHPINLSMFRDNN